MKRSEPRVLFLDTNLLVLLVVGLTSESLINRHKKTKTFKRDDFDLLLALPGEKTILITPHVAAEASNLICFHGEPERGRLLQTFKTLVKRLREQHVASGVAVEQKEFSYLRPH